MQTHTFFIHFPFQKRGAAGLRDPAQELLFGERGMSLKILPSLCTRQVEIGERTGTPGTKYE